MISGVMRATLSEKVLNKCPIMGTFLDFATPQARQMFGNEQTGEAEIVKVKCAGVHAMRPVARRIAEAKTPISYFFMETSGGRLVWEDVAGPLTDAHVGELCVLWLDDGSVVAKRPFPAADGPGLYDLLSFFGPTILGARVMQAALVLQIVTRGEVARQARGDAIKVDEVAPFPRRALASLRASVAATALAASLLFAAHVGPHDVDGDGIITMRDMYFARGVDGA